MDTQAQGILGLFAPECKGEDQTPVHTQQAQASGDETESAPAAGEQTQKEREKAFRALIEGEYKDLFTAYFQETFNRRFKEYKQIKAELECARSISQAAAEHFGIREQEGLLRALRANKAQEQAPTEAAELAPGTSGKEPDADAKPPLPRQRRPAESALGIARDSMPGVARMTKEERAELAKRAARGEYITL